MLPRSMGLRGTPRDDAAAVRLGRDSWMCINHRSFRSLRPRPSDHRRFSELELSQHVPAAMWAYATKRVASGGSFHLRYDGAVCVTLSDEPQLLEVGLIRGNGSQSLTGHYLVRMLPQSYVTSGEEQFVVSGRHVINFVGVSNRALSCTHASPVLRDLRGGTICRLRATCH